MKVRFKKKFWAICICVIMLLSCAIPSFIYDSYGASNYAYVTVDNNQGIPMTFYLTLDQKIASLWGISNEGDPTDVNIPATVTYDNEEYTVMQVNLDTSSSYTSNKNANVTGLNFPNENIAISKIRLPDMTEFTVPGYITEFTGNFQNCTKLEKLTFEEGVETINGNMIVSGCKNFTTVNLPSTLKTIAHATFSSATALKNITLPEGLETLGYSAFSGCTSLESIILPAGITEIEYMTFSGCTSLKSVTAKGTITSIGRAAFNGCTALEKIPNLAYVEEMGTRAFQDCSMLGTDDGVLDLSSLASIPDNAFAAAGGSNTGDTKITKIKFCDELTSIGDNAFSWGFYYLSEDITFPQTLTSIGEYAFKYGGFYVEGLTVTIPDSVTSIGQQAFYGFGAKEIYVGSGVDQVNSGTFAYDSGYAVYLQKITFNNAKDDVTITSGAIPDGVEIVWLETSVDEDAGDKISSADDAPTLQEAIDAAPDDTETTITISKDIRLDSTLKIPANKKITIKSADGENYTIIGKTDAGLTTLIDIAAAADGETPSDVTFEDITISGHDNTGATIYNRAKLTLGDGTTIKRAHLQSSKNGVVAVSGSDASLLVKEGVKIENNRISAGSSGTIYVSGGGKVVMEGGEIYDNVVSLSSGYVASSGIMVYEDAAAEISGGEIKNNSSVRGAALFLYSMDRTKQAKATISGGTITENACASQNGADAGGAVGVEGNSKLVMTGGKITKNTGGFGAGVTVLDNALLDDSSTEYGTTFLMQGGTISGNKASSTGGAIYTFSNGTRLTAGTIENNSAYMGGGIYCEGNQTRYSTMHMENALITDNLSNDQGGGMYFCATGGGEGDISNGGAIFGNTADGSGDDVVFAKTPVGEDAKLTLTNRLLGGGKAAWHEDGALAATGAVGVILFPNTNSKVPRYPDTSADEVDVNGITSSIALKAVADADAISLAEEKAELFIKNNTASHRGGGVASNGGVVIGTVEDEYSLTVTKEWSEDTPKDKKTSVRVYLKIGEHQRDEYVDLTEENNWTATITGLPDPATLGDTKISVVESPVPDDFTVTYSDAEIDTSNRTIKIKVTNDFEKPDEDNPGDQPKTPKVPDKVAKIINKVKTSDGAKLGILIALCAAMAAVGTAVYRRKKNA